jgi:hypothetical protein
MAMVSNVGLADFGVLVDPGLQNTNPAATLRAGAIDLAEPGRRAGVPHRQLRST